MQTKISKYAIENILLFVFFSIIFFFIFFTMQYSDGIVNAYVGYGICNSIFKGTFGQFFHKVSWSYGLTIYIIYAIWSVPIVLSDIVTGKTTELWVDRSAMIWYKGLLLLFFIMSCYFFYKIVLQMIEDKGKGMLLTFLLATSSIMVFIPFAITQCDVISLAFSLAGIYYLMEKKDVAFIIFFGLAVTMKYIPLFIFIPLFLYRYKKPKQMLAIGLATSGLLIVSAIIITFSKGAKQALENPAFFDVAAQIRGFFEGSNISLGIGNLSIVVAYFTAICVVAHLVGEQSTTMYKRWILWLCLASWYTLVIFFGANVYWYVLIAPFILLILLNNPKHFGFGLFVEVTLSNLMLLERVNTQYWVLGGGNTFSYLFLRGKLLGHTTLLRELFNRVTFGFFSSLESIYVAVIVVLAFSLLYVFRPQEDVDITGITKRNMKIAIWAHIIILFVWTGLMLAEAIRLTQGTEYSTDYFTYSENVQVTEEGAILRNGDYLECPYFSLEPGMYRLKINAIGVTPEDVRVTYYYNEEFPIGYNVIEVTESGAIIEFSLEEYKETVQFNLINSNVDEIVFQSYILSEIR